MVNNSETKLIELLALIVQEFHQHNKYQREMIEIHKEFNTKFADEQFKLLEIMEGANENDKGIKQELKELNKPVE